MTEMSSQTALCRHGASKYECKSLSGLNVCHHGRLDEFCRCQNRYGYCPHGRQSELCRCLNRDGYCHHGKILGSCECGGHPDLCEHGRPETTCKGRNGTCHNHDPQDCRCLSLQSRCVHGRDHSCVDCIDIETAIARGYVCLVCRERRNRSGICSPCFRQFMGTDNIRIEAIVNRALRYMFQSLRLPPNNVSAVQGDRWKSMVPTSVKIEQR